MAACSLTAAAIAGLIERRRPYALLRASGVRLGELRRVLLLETGVPMLVLGVLTATASSYAFQDLRGQPWGPPGLDLAAVVGGGLLAALAIFALTLPLLAAVTRPDRVRSE